MSTAIFSTVYSVLLQPLPYPKADRLIAIWTSAPKIEYSRFYVNAARWRDWREHSTTLEDIALTRPVANFNLTGDGAPERLQGARTSCNLFSVLGVRPLLGRTFTEEEQRNDARVAVLSYAFWKKRFGGNASTVGRKILLNGDRFEVIGIMPPSCRYPTSEFELWSPLYIPPDEFQHGMNNQYLCLGRLKAGVNVEQAQAEFTHLTTQFSKQHPSYYNSVSDIETAFVEPLSRSDAHTVRATLYALLGAVGCLLLIGCLNLAILLLARANARVQETAVRSALGATHGRLRRQSLAELIPLSASGIAGGLLFAWCMLRVCIRYLPVNTPRLDSIAISVPAVLFAAGLSLAVILLAGLLPSGDNLQQRSRSVTARTPLRSALVIAQIACSLILLLQGLLFAHSFAALLRVHPGFSSRDVLTMQIAVSRAKYPQDERVADYYSRLVTRVSSLPGVLGAGIINRLPFSGLPQTGGIEFEGRAGQYDSDWRTATPGYFRAMEIPLQQGRFLQDADQGGTTRVGLIDEPLARRVFGLENPIGKCFRRYLPGFSPKDQDPWTVVVGVVGHILNDSLEQQDTRSQVYWPETQHTQDRGALVVRTAGDPATFAHLVEAQIRSEDPDQPVYDVKTMTQWVDRTLQGRTLLTGAVALFSAASLLLACIGLYGVVSYTATLRSREFGIRMALGADGLNVCALVLRHAITLALFGSVTGLTVAWPLSYALRRLLFGISSGDVLAWLFAPVLLFTMALFSSFGPAWRAARIDPAITMRTE